MSTIDKLVDTAVNTAGKLVVQAVDAIPDLVGAGMDAGFNKADQYIEENQLIDKGLDGALNFVTGGSAPVAAAAASSAAQLNGNIKPHSTELADGTIVLEPGNTPDALTAEAALHSGKPMPGEKPLSDKWWKKINPEEGPSNFMSQYDTMDQSGRFSFTNFGEFLQALFKKFLPTNEEGARMASNAPFKNLKLEDGTPVAVPKDIESIDPKTGKTPEPEQAVNPLAPNPMQQMAMGMNNPTPGMKFA